jgi:hypothetical protein
LERIHACVQQRLDQIEALARARAPSQSAADADCEPALRQTIVELEQTRERLHAESDCHDREWHTALEQLENDRRLLAQAWERLERERIEALAAPHGHSPAPSRQAERPASFPARGMTADETNDAIAQAILRQFQSLQSDVRRAAQERCSLGCDAI